MIQTKRQHATDVVVVCYVCVFVLLLAMSLCNFQTPAVELTLRCIFTVLWAILLVEQVARFFKMSKQERIQYSKLETVEVVFFLLSIVLLPVTAMGLWTAARWFILLKLPAVLHRTDDEKSFQVIVNTLVGILICIFLFPFLQVVAVSISAPGNIINLWPKDIDFWGIQYVLSDKSFFRAIVSSVTITIIGTVISVLSMTMAAYPLSKKDMPLRRTMMVFFLVVMLFNGGMAPNILLMNSLGLTNKIWALIFPSIVMVFHLLLLKGFFEDIPAELEESAKLDGASNYTILFRIIVPVAAPMIATVVFFTAISFWNNINNSILYITSNQAIYPLPMYVKNFLSKNPMDIASMNPMLLTYWDNVKMSYILISILPVLAVYPYVFKYIKNGVTMGAVKG